MTRRSLLLFFGFIMAGCGSDERLPPVIPVGTATPETDLFVLVQDVSGRLRVEQGGKLRLYVVGPDEQKIAGIDAVDIIGHLQPEDETEGIRVTLKPDPQPGDKSGQASEFQGDIPESMRGKPLLASLNLTLKGERFRAAFRSTPAGRDHVHEWMADRGVSLEDQKKLYLTPAGKYTEADIKANGNVTAAQKYRGVMARHDMKPKPGDKICPITETKANSKFTWIVNGQSYEFCCPPCIDEFVQLAKEKPEELRPPGEYVKK